MAEPLVILTAALEGVGPGSSVAQKVALARAAVTGGDSGKASAMLKAFANEVAAQSGKKIALDTAAALTEAATRIDAVLG